MRIERIRAEEVEIDRDAVPELKRKRGTASEIEPLGDRRRG